MEPRSITIPILKHNEVKKDIEQTDGYVMIQ